MRQDFASDHWLVLLPTMSCQGTGIVEKAGNILKGRGEERHVGKKKNQAERINLTLQVHFAFKGTPGLENQKR